MVRTWMWKAAASAAVLVAVASVAMAAGAQRAGGDRPSAWAGGVVPTENRFVPIVPCRIVNTQNGPPLPVGEARGYSMAGDTRPQGGAQDCGIPTYATALEVNVTAVRSQGNGYLRMGPTDAAIPNATFLNYSSSVNLSNAGTIAVEAGAGVNLQVRAFVRPTHVVIDVLGYYVAALHATVSPTGELLAGSGVLTVSRFAAGQFEVVFDRDVSGCGISGNRSFFGTGTQGGEVKVSAIFGKAIVEVFTAEGAYVDDSFVVTVAC